LGKLLIFDNLLLNILKFAQLNEDKLPNNTLRNIVCLYDLIREECSMEEMVTTNLEENVENSENNNENLEIAEAIEVEGSRQPEHLAWHETLEIHELVAFQAIGLVKLKTAFPEITSPELKNLYNQAIMAITNNLNELVQFYPLAPNPGREEDERVDILPFYAGDLLALAKTSVRNYSIAVTETATPVLRSVLTKQLLGAIELHGSVYQYMYERNLYPSYNLNQLLQNDINIVQKALAMPF
jgi:spore coat protein F